MAEVVPLHTCCLSESTDSTRRLKSSFSLLGFDLSELAASRSSLIASSRLIFLIVGGSYFRLRPAPMGRGYPFRSAMLNSRLPLEMGLMLSAPLLLKTSASNFLRKPNKTLESGTRMGGKHSEVALVQLRLNHGGQSSWVPKCSRTEFHPPAQVPMQKQNTRSRAYFTLPVPAGASNVKVQGHFKATGGSGNALRFFCSAKTNSLTARTATRRPRSTTAERSQPTTWTLRCQTAQRITIWFLTIGSRCSARKP